MIQVSQKIQVLLICSIMMIHIPSTIKTVKGQTQLNLESDPVEYWGLVIGADNSGWQSYSHDANYMFHVLNVHYRFDGIYYLSLDTDLPGVDNVTTKNNVRAAITGWLANRSDENDIVSIFWSSHGGGYNSHTGQLSNDQCIDGSRSDRIDESSEIWNSTAGKWVGIDECLYVDYGGPNQATYWDDELAWDLTNLTYGRLVFSCMACFSGGFIDDLSATNRVILTAANETYTASAGSTLNSWAKSYIDALHGEVGNWSTSTDRLSHTGIGCNADLNNDSHVSMWEAWNYSWWNDTKRIDGSETPWLDANSNGLPTFKNEIDNSSPYEEPGDRTNADAVWLPKKVEGDINNDNTVDIYDAILLANAFNSNESSLHWDRRTDLNTDGQVDIYDALILAGKFGKSMGGGSTLSMETMAAGASVVLEPSELSVFKGETFSVNVRITDVGDLAGWEFKLYWNNTILNCTSAVIQTPLEWQNNTQSYGPGLEPYYNSTHARYFKAQSRVDPASSFNGSMTIVTLIFQAMQPGTTPLLFQETKLGDSTAQPITLAASSGSVSVYYGRYMRSDTQQVNDLSAYRLNIPQSTSPAVNTQSGSGAGALWGIRSWIRHSNGVEQEISLDGQTGTPKADVGGGVGGIRSSTVSVAQTALQSTDSLVVRVYVQIADGPWNLCATFTTEQLQSSTLRATVWTVYYYTFSSYNRVTDRTTARFYWGTTTYNSRIQNLQFT